jgi:hypothetical protein
MDTTTRREQNLLRCITSHENELELLRAMVWKLRDENFRLEQENERIVFLRTQVSDLRRSHEIVDRQVDRLQGENERLVRLLAGEDPLGD